MNYLTKLLNIKLNYFLCMILFCLISVNVFAAQANTKDKSTENIKVLYYDKVKEIKLINKDNFILKIEKNDKGLKRVTEIGRYPDGYPHDSFPPPYSHVDKENKKPEK